MDGGGLGIDGWKQGMLASWSVSYGEGLCISGTRNWVCICVV